MGKQNMMVQLRHAVTSRSGARASCPVTQSRKWSAAASKPYCLMIGMYLKTSFWYSAEGGFFAARPCKCDGVRGKWKENDFLNGHTFQTR